MLKTVNKTLNLAFFETLPALLYSPTCISPKGGGLPAVPPPNACCPSDAPLVPVTASRLRSRWGGFPPPCFTRCGCCTMAPGMGPRREGRGGRPFSGVPFGAPLTVPAPPLGSRLTEEEGGDVARGVVCAGGGRKEIENK